MSRAAPQPGRLSAAFVFLALLFLLVRPVCAAHEPVQAASGLTHASSVDHSEDPEPCCAALDDGSPVPAVKAVFPEGKSAGDAMAATASARLTLDARAHVAVHPPQRPPRSLPYHVRSTRLLI